MSESKRTAIVVEGGGMRGVFHAGVLDAFLERDFHPFDLAIGSSAGACNLGSHLAGQHGRNRRVYTGAMCDPRFIRLSRVLTGGHGMDLDWLWKTLDETDRLDAESATGSATQYVVCATSAQTGDPVYLEPSADELGPALKGSCAVPIFYRGPVVACGQPIVDGGVGDPIPVREAYRRGARRILVVRTRPARYRKSTGFETSLGAWVHRHQPPVARAIRRMPVAYSAAIDFMESPPPDCELVQIAPKKPLRTGRTTTDASILEADYALGRELGFAAVGEW